MTGYLRGGFDPATGSRDQYTTMAVGTFTFDPGTQTESVRRRYAEQGVEAYYQRQGATYRNPHEPIVRRLIMQISREWPLDLSHVLDLAAGSGEVTLAVLEAGAGRVEAIDPYTFAAYEQRTGKPAARLTFERIAGEGLGERQFSLIICSFAMHLCEQSRLPRLAFQLSNASPSLLILTPNKRPILRPQWGWTLERETMLERVRARLYGRNT